MYNYNDSLHIDKILYVSKGRDNFDEEYKNIREKKKLLELKDKKNVLYVALTRAIDSLIVLKKEKSSIFDILDMTPFSIGEIKIEKQIQPPVKEIEKVDISNYGIQDNIKDDNSDEKDYEALLFGSGLHYALEMLNDFDISHLPQSLMALENKYGNQLSKDSIKEIQERIKTLLNFTPFTNLLDGAKIIKEQSLSYQGELKKVDLILQYDTHNIVIDYKSSKKFYIKNINQIKYYKEAISSITNKPTQAKIIYLFNDDVEIVEV
jgi:exodeoxyribonuclease V beta subunit